LIILTHYKKEKEWKKKRKNKKRCKRIRDYISAEKQRGEVKLS